MLAILTMLKQGIDVTALSFLTPFNTPAEADLSHDNKDKDIVTDDLRYDIYTHRLTETFIEIVKTPRFGYGKHMNPCIDCRILMLREARIFMDEIGADFIITGEVLGQRPMSQRRDMLNRIDREAGVKGYVLRPLSAKLLSVTIPEEEGIVNRDLLHDFSGRSRRQQMDLAREFKLVRFPAPAGGCLLTDPIFAQKLRDLLTYNPNPAVRDITLLKTGRHFRLSPSCKIIVGRNQKENEILESLAGENDSLISIEGYGSPTTLVSGTHNDEALQIAASLCARYSDAKGNSRVNARVVGRHRTYNISVSGASNEVIEILRIGGKKDRNVVNLKNVFTGGMVD